MSSKNEDRNEYFRLIIELRLKDKEVCEEVEKFLIDNGLECVMVNPLGSDKKKFSRAIQIVTEALKNVDAKKKIYTEWKKRHVDGRTFNYIF